MTKEKEIRASSVVASQSAKGVATVKGQCLDKMEKALHLYHKILIF